MTALLPPREVCPLCGHDDDITTMPDPVSDDWTYICLADPETVPFHPYEWEVSAVAEQGGGGGIMSELGLFDDLLDCLVEGEPYVEHGIVEHRYKLAHPDIYFGELLPRYGHVRQGPKKYTVSSLIGQALGHLLKNGDVQHQWVPATGFWSYNARISSWALPPGPASDEKLSWVEFAAGNGIDPSSWDLSDLR